MLSVLNVVAPVFALIGLGYLAVRLRLYPSEGVAGLIAFVNNFATPCLLFRAMLTVDFRAAFNPGILVSFYAGALIVLVIGMTVARLVFKRRPGEAVACGFSATFSNTVLVGLPIMQRAFGADSLPVVYSIIGLHAPLLLSIGMLVMEMARRDGGKFRHVLVQGGRTILTNPLLIGIALGLVGNALNVTLIEPVDVVTELLASAVLPVALFGVGGALNFYKIGETWTQAAAMSALKLIVHPAIAWVLMVPVFHVDPMIARYGVVLAAMPAGINVYIFATFYSRAVNVAASTVLISTVASVISISFWLLVLAP